MKLEDLTNTQLKRLARYYNLHTKIPNISKSTREQLLEKFPSAKTYPVVVIDGFNIGGYTELKEQLERDYSNNQQLLNE